MEQWWITEASQLFKEMASKPTQATLREHINAASTGSGVSWGLITGTLASQVDLQGLLDTKSGTSHNHDA